MIILPEETRNDLKKLDRVLGSFFLANRRFKILGKDETLHFELINRAVEDLSQNELTLEYELRDTVEQLAGKNRDSTIRFIEQAITGYRRLGLADAAENTQAVLFWVKGLNEEDFVTDPEWGDISMAPSQQDRLADLRQKAEQIRENLKASQIAELVATQLKASWGTARDFNVQMAEKILSSDAFVRLAQQDKGVSGTIWVGPHSGIDQIITDAGVRQKLLLMNFVFSGEMLLYTDVGPLLFRLDEFKVEPFISEKTRPEVKVDLVRQKDGADRINRQAANYKAYSRANKQVFDTQQYLARWIGNQHARLAMPFVHPLKTYRVALTLGGLGLSNKALLTIWANVATSAAFFVIVWIVFDLPSDFHKVVNFDHVSFLSWALNTLQCIVVAYLTLLGLSELFLGVSSLHGTVLRAFGRQPVRGNPRIPDTGQNNIILQLLGHKSRVNG